MESADKKSIRTPQTIFEIVEPSLKWIKSKIMMMKVNIIKKKVSLECSEILTVPFFFLLLAFTFQVNTHTSKIEFVRKRLCILTYACMYARIVFFIRECRFQCDFAFFTRQTVNYNNVQLLLVLFNENIYLIEMCLFTVTCIEQNFTFSQFKP